MPTLELNDDALTVRLALWEKLASFQGNLRIPLRHVRGATDDDGFRGTALGLRAEDHALNGSSPARELPAPLWRIATAPCGRAQLEDICQRWFFSSRHMQAAPGGRFRAHLVAAFIESLDQSLAGYAMHTVMMTPPMWYAIHWDEIAFELGGDRYLLHFSHSD